jgi:3-oxoadipate enol-lactonase
VPERLGEVTAPTLVIVGEREMAGFRAFADEIAEGIPNARLEILENHGHLHLLETPDQVANLLIDHLVE